MKIAVVGAGIVGITTAYELARDGHEVTVFERRGAAAEESSFANAGVVAPGYVTPWAAPGMPRKILQNLFNRHAAITLTLPLAGADMAWLWRWWRACKPDAYLAHRAHLQKLAFYSRERLHHISADLQLDYDRSDGYMVLLRSEADHKMIQMSLQVLKDAGVAFNELDAAAARKIEPALNPDTPFAGAIHLPQDEVGNCRQFALLLKNESQKRGVVFAFNTTVLQVAGGSTPTVLLQGETTPRSFNAVVMCAGLGSASLLKPLGLKIPLAAVYGYSISAPIREALNAPRSAVMDEHFKVAISRLGNRVRVAGSAELGGSAHKHRAASIQTLYKVLHDWFPGAAQQSSGVQVWKGARPMLPDGPPLIGASGVAGVWLNLGHGSSGWALSCGSARVLADLLAGRPAAVDLTGFAATRYAG
jgi:D-amino-acid dehydrogenase